MQGCLQNPHSLQNEKLVYPRIGCLQSLKNTMNSEHGIEDSTPHSSPNDGLTPANSTALTEHRKQPKKRSKRHKISGQASPSGENTPRSQDRAVASSPQKPKKQRTAFASPSPRGKRDSCTVSQSASVLMQASAVPPKRSPDERPVPAEADILLQGTPSPRSIAFGEAGAEVVSSSVRTFDSIPNNEERKPSNMITATIVAVTIAVVVGIVIFSMVINGQQGSKHAIVANTRKTRTTAKIKTSVQTPRRQGNEVTASTGLQELNS
ncbi:uncharacterized protein [Dermacentor albipictus]|uniref:uncharacterized protein n=1 Tax=Dermacentor albipictus TaxID=60249 RepID=UPI0038FCF6B4